MTKTKWKKHVSELRKQAKPYQKKPCPTPKKIPYVSINEVNKAITSMHIHGKYARSYKCPCGLYHTSTRTPKRQQRAANQQRTRKQNTQAYREKREKQRQREKLREHNRAQVMSA